MSAANLPPPYRWLRTEPGPKMLRRALELYGVLEAPGDADNPVILAWAAEVGERTVAIHRSDAVPWCGLFMAVVALRAHKPLPAIPSRAISWATFGQPCSTPMLGDTLIFQRTGGGHVGLYIGEDERAYNVLGGNQSDAVTITRIAKQRLLTSRRPRYAQQPPNVRVVRLSAAGVRSRRFSLLSTSFLPFFIIDSFLVLLRFQTAKMHNPLRLSVG